MSLPSPLPKDERLKETASRFRYPPTPDVTRAVIHRIEGRSRLPVRMRNGWAIASLVLLILVVLFAVPGVRAEIVRFLQVGVVRIFPTTPTETALPSVLQAPETATPAAVLPDTAAPQPGFTPAGPAHALQFADLAGETSLEEARAKVAFPIRLPTDPAGLGTPDHVFLQENALMVILVWADPTDPHQARLSLHEIASGSILVGKFQPRVILETQVNGHYAVWVEGPYLVQLKNGAIEFRRTVAGNTLIWEAQGITYRLETSLALEEAVRIAESLE